MKADIKLIEQNIMDQYWEWSLQVDLLNLVLKTTNKRTNFDYENYFRFKNNKLDNKYTYQGVQ